MQVQPVDMSTISDLHSRKDDCTDLISASPMVRFSTPLRRYAKPVMVTVPLPSPHNRTRQRPKTAALSDRSQNTEHAKARPASAFGHMYQQKQGY